MCVVAPHLKMIWGRAQQVLQIDCHSWFAAISSNWRWCLTNFAVVDKYSESWTVYVWNHEECYLWHVSQKKNINVVLCDVYMSLLMKFMSEVITDLFAKVHSKACLSALVHGRSAGWWKYDEVENLFGFWWRLVSIIPIQRVGSGQKTAVNG